MRHYRNIYLGSNSWWAVKDKVYAEGSGVNRKTAPSIIALILLDLSRGYSYDRHGKKIKFNLRKALKRLYYLITLAKKHSPKDKEYVSSLVHYVASTLHIPRNARIKLEGAHKNIAYYLLRKNRFIGKTAVEKKRHRAKPVPLVRVRA